MRSLFTTLLLLPLFCGALGAALPTGLNSSGQLQTVDASKTSGFTYVRLEYGVQLRAAGLTKNVLFYGPSTVRVNATLGQSFAEHPSLVVVAPPATVPFELQDATDTLTITSQKLRIVADKRTGALTFLDAKGHPYTRERAESATELREVTISQAPTYEVKQSFTLATDESLYGLGQYNQSYMDYRGQTVPMVQTNIGIVVPLLISTKRYGLMWDVYSKSVFKDDATGASFWAESAPGGSDYYFIGGDSMDGVIAGYRNLTGAAPMIPKAAFGLFMSKERYKTQSRLLEVVKSFREDQFPLDYIVQDWQYWGGDKDGTWSGMIWNQERFPDPAGMIKTLHDDLHVKLMISIWPSIGDDTELAKELDSHGLRFEPLHWISKHARIYDAFSPEGRAIYFKHIKRGLLDVGVDALWMDGTEVEVGSACHDAGVVEADIKRLGKNALGDFTRYLNVYSLLTTKGTYEGQRATSNQRVFTLTRSAWTGQQRYSAIAWSGDTTASWSTLRAQIAGGLNVAMAGQPYWTQDTGGFFVNIRGGEKNPEYRELYARWNQFGIFNPIYRIHGTQVEREPYIFKTLDPEVYQSLRDAAHLRYRLLPYIYSLAWQSTAHGYTMMRGLAMDFPDDPKVRKIDDAFMFGPAFLVHPITRAMYHVGVPPPPTIPPAALSTPDGKPGVAVSYFQGRNFETPAGNTVDAKIDYTWPGPPLANPPAGLTSLNDFSGRWAGTVTAPEDGEYEIGIEGDDGIRLWLDGKLVAEDWTSHPRTYKGAKVTLKKDQKLSVKIEYYQGDGERALRLAWRTPSEIQAFNAAKPKLNNTVETYLPAGADWYDFWTNERYTGGQTVRTQCPLDRFPVFVRAGSIVPLGPVVQYATERPDAPYELRVYPGADAQFTLYEDDNETYRYERGEHATYDLQWNDRAHRLTLGARQGTFPSLVSERELRLTIAAPGKNSGTGEGASVQAVAKYRGQPVSLGAP